jgi:hypothetical protein
VQPKKLLGTRFILRRSEGADDSSLMAKDSRPTGSKNARAEAMEKGPRTCLGQ